MIYIINHGETTKDEWGNNTPLSYKGKEQAENLGKLWFLKELDKVYTSTSTRCILTAEAMFPGREIVKNPVLDELNFGDLEGTYIDPLDDIRYHSSPEAFLISHGGSDIEKAVAEFDTAVIRMKGDAAVVTCPDIMRLWFAKRKNVSFATGLTIELGYCQIIEFDGNPVLRPHIAKPWER